MTITIYSTAECAACHALTGWLDKQNISYTKKITDEDPAVMAEFMNVNDGNIGVPFSIVSNDAGEQTKILGFDQPAFKKALGL
jgi:glutaredoxin